MATSSTGSSTLSLPLPPQLAESTAPGDQPILRRHDNNAVLKSSKARPNKDQYGWGNLPPALINRILSLNDWRYGTLPNGSPQVIRAVRCRQALVQMRLVSSGWNNAINNHPFWADQYLKLMRPDLKHADVHNNNTTRTELQFVRILTAMVCIPCRLYSHPSIPPRTAKRDYMTATNKLGHIATCDAHYNTFCTNCLRPSIRDDIRLFASKSGDVDGTGMPLPVGDLVCHVCREHGIIMELQRALMRCARDGPRFGNTVSWSQTAAFTDHVYFGAGNSRSMAELAVEDEFLLHNTPLKKRLDDAYTLQALMWTIKTNLFKYQHHCPSKSETLQYKNLVSRIWDDEYSEYEDGPDLKTVFHQWQKQVATGQYDDEDCRWDQMRLHYGCRALTPLIRDRLVEACVTEWAKERFYSGYWVMPSDEVAQLASGRTDSHTPLQDIANLARLPLKPHSTPYAKRLPRVGAGRFFPPGSDNGKCFLPPVSLVKLFDDQFTGILQRRLEGPLGEIVEMIRICHPPGFAEAVCDSLGIPQLLEYLGKEAAWVEGRFVSTAAKNTTPPSEPTTATSEPPRSPHIEAVKDHESGGTEFVVQEGWDSPTEHEATDDLQGASEDDIVDDDDESDDGQLFCQASPAPEVEGSLGKRKQSSEEDEMNDEPIPHRPRLGSGQTSHSSSGDTVNTALVTPDDSPDMMASAIQLASDEEAAMEVTVEAAPNPNPAPTSPSSSLGKRKLAQEDDGGEEHPSRRREARSVSDSTSGSEKQDKAHSTEETSTEALVSQSAPPAKTESSASDKSSDNSEEAEHRTESVTISARSSPEQGETLLKLAEPEPEPASEPTPSQEPEDYAESLYDTDYSQSDFEGDELEYSLPHVPAPMTMLGPVASYVIRSAWWTARAPLRECSCRICLRAKKEEEETRMLYSNLWDPAILRIM